MRAGQVISLSVKPYVATGVPQAPERATPRAAKFIDAFGVPPNKHNAAVGAEPALTPRDKHNAARVRVNRWLLAALAAAALAATALACAMLRGRRTKMLLPSYKAS